MKIPKSVAKGMIGVGLAGVLGGAGCSLYNGVERYQCINGALYERLEEIEAQQEMLEEEAISYLFLPEDGTLAGRFLSLRAEYFILTREMANILESDEYLANAASCNFHQKQIWTGLGIESFFGFLFVVPGVVATYHRKKEEREK